MTRSGLRIGLFGGAFDPVHTGHIRVAESFLNSNMIDKLQILPTAQPPHKESDSSASFHDRCAMLRLAFSDYDHVEVNEIEKDLSKPSYTLQTINHLQQTHPEHTYFLCIGEDNLATFHEWYKYREILDRVSLLVARRPGADSATQKTKILEQAIFIDHEEIEISSTNIRSKNRLDSISEKIPDRVLNYIQDHNLYAN